MRVIIHEKVLGSVNRNGGSSQMTFRNSTARHSIMLCIAACALAQSQPSHLEFETISIKPWAPGQEGGGITTLPGGQEYRARGTAVIGMISVIYRILIPQIQGGPEWIKTDRWDVDAKADRGGYHLDELHGMYKDLLANRFSLRFHWAKKEGKIYSLTIDKSGLKMKANDKPDPLKGGVPIIGDPLARDGVAGRGVAMEYLTWWLGQRLQQDGRPLVNNTGLDGYYDFNLLYMPELPVNFPPDRLPPDAGDRPDIFRALREQLGLQLKAENAPVDMFVIDSIAKPGPN